MKRQALKAAFPHTVPVLLGYVSMGIAFGILLNSKGYHFGWAFLISLLIYSGAMQFVAINLLVPGVQLIQAAFITLMVNARHLFYGLSLIDTYRNLGKKKAYMIFSLTDETYSLISGKTPPPGVEPGWFYFFICLLNQSYWIIGCTMGALLGSFLHFNTKGIDFVMTALFTVILIDMLRESKGFGNAAIGIGGSILCLLLFGPQNFLIPAMAAILALVTLFRKKLDKKKEAAEEC